jgi:hypothetical protein
MSFAGNTLITVPSGAVEIAQLRAGDGLLAAGPDLQWTYCTVKMAEELPGGVTVTLTFSGGSALVVSPDQLLLGARGQLVRADSVGVGDQLLNAGRQSLRVVNVASESISAMYDLATSATGADGHLVEANGIVAADFDQQAATGS